MAVLSIAGCQATTVERPVATDRSDWRIRAHVGQVAVRRPGQPFWQTARLGDTVRPGSQVATTPGGQLTLASADDVITAAERSRLAVVDDAPEHTAIRQDLGRVRYQVRSAPQRRFEVETPYMATVVKGTTFEIAVSAQGAAVEVEEGRVWASSRDRRPEAELAPGQAARAAAGSGILEVRRDPDGPFEAMPGAGAKADPGPVAKTTRPSAPDAAWARPRGSKPFGPSVQAAKPADSFMGGLRASLARMTSGLRAAWRGGRQDGDQINPAPEVDDAISASGTTHGKAGQALGGGPGGGKGGGPGGGKGGNKGGGKGQANLTEDPGRGSRLL